MTPDGPDLGSPGAQPLPAPKIALLTGGGGGRSYGEGAGAYDAGQVWHLLGERFGVPVSLLDVDRVGAADLDRYDVLVMAGGGYGGLPADSLRGWVEAGGRLVALATAVDWVAEQGLLDLTERSAPIDSLVADAAYGELPRAYGAHQIGGAILRARVDTTHPVAYGLPAELPVFRTHESFHEPTGRPGRDVAVYAEDEPLWSGYLSEARREQAAGAAAVMAGRHGDGRIVAIADDPNFRAFWYGTNRLFLNAVFLGGTF